MALRFQSSLRCVFASLLVSLLPLGPTSDAQEATGKYVDNQYDFSIAVPAPWQRGRLEDYTVPGVARAAFAKPGGASIVLFIQEPGKAFEPRFLVDESAKAMEKSLGATVRTSEVRTVAGKQAMWLVLEGQGTGGALDGKGNVKTSQHWVAFPRQTDILVAILTSPSNEFADNAKSFEAAIKNMVVGGTQTPAQSASK